MPLELAPQISAARATASNDAPGPKVLRSDDQVGVGAYAEDAISASARRENREIVKRGGEIAPERSVSGELARVRVSR